MNINNNTPKTSFFQRLGNWFNKNGNTVGKGMQIAGTTAMGVGMTGMFFDAMNKPTSIFGGCYSPFGMIGMGGGCCSPYSMMGMGGSLFGMGGFGGCSTSMAANMSYQYGAMIAMQENMMMNMQMQQGGNAQYPALATNPYMQNYMNMNPYMQNFSTANPYSFNFSTDAQSSTDTDTETDKKWSHAEFKGTKLKDGEGSEVEGEKFDLQTDKLGLNNLEEIEIADKNADEDAIKKSLKTSGQNLVAKLDTSGDGYVDLNEYVANESTKTNYNATIAKRAFDKMDTNDDNKLDWTELAAVNGVFTMDTSDKEITTKITQDNYNAWSKALGSAKNDSVVKQMINVRKWLMGSSES